ncbi:MAG: hypothetical protein RRY29_06995 [Desulfovibrionaceae bacterium]
MTKIATPTGAVTVKISDGKGTVSKTFAAKTPENMQWMPMSMTARDQFWTMSKDGSVSLNLNIKQDKPVANGKVSLVAYTDVAKITDGSPWAVDARFLARPET